MRWPYAIAGGSSCLDLLALPFVRLDAAKNCFDVWSKQKTVHYTSYAIAASIAVADQVLDIMILRVFYMYIYIYTLFAQRVPPEKVSKI